MHVHRIYILKDFLIRLDLPEHEIVEKSFSSLGHVILD
jgi:hypothetical protein